MHRVFLICLTCFNLLLLSNDHKLDLKSLENYTSINRSHIFIDDGDCDSAFKCNRLAIYAYNNNKSMESIKYFNKSLDFLNLDCSKNLINSCLELARIYENGSFNIIKDTEESFHFYSIVCKLDKTKCSLLSTFYKDDIYKHRVIKSLQSACDTNSSLACYDLSQILNDNDILFKAKKLFENECKNDHAKSCKMLGDIRLLKKYKDESISSKAYDKACRLGDIDSCEGFSVFYSYNTAKDKIKSIYQHLIKEHKSRCEFKAIECIKLADVYIREDVVKNNKKILQSYKMACNLDPRECINIALIYDTTKLDTCKLLNKSIYCLNEKGLKNTVNAEFFYNLAHRFYNSGCSENDINSCIINANIYEMQNISRHAFFYNRACELGNAMSCGIITNIHMTNNDQKSATKTYEKMLSIYNAECTTNALSCKKLGDIYALKERFILNTQPDSKKAQQFYKYACDLGHTECCNTE